MARPFIEFRWANEFRKRFYSTGIYRESDQAQVMAFEAIFNDVMKFALSEEAKHLEGWNEMRPQFTDLVTIDEHGCVADDYSAHLEASEAFWKTHPTSEHPGRHRHKMGASPLVVYGELLSLLQVAPISYLGPTGPTDNTGMQRQTRMLCSDRQAAVDR